MNTIHFIYGDFKRADHILKMSGHFVIILVKAGWRMNAAKYFKCERLSSSHLSTVMFTVQLDTLYLVQQLLIRTWMNLKLKIILLIKFYLKKAFLQVHKEQIIIFFIYLEKCLKRLGLIQGGNKSNKKNINNYIMETKNLW